MRYGAIYIAHNPRDGESLFKVGKTERLVDERMKELTSASSNLGVYTARAYFIVAGVDEAERACHKRLSRYRVQSNREFFDIPFERLVHIVTEVLEPYAANASIPETQDHNFPDSSVPIDPKEKLEEIRKRNLSESQTWDITLEESKRILEDWSKIIKTKTIEAKEQLVDEQTLRWEITDGTIKNNKYGQYQPFCTVSVYAQFKEAPVVLTLSGIRGGIYGDLDLSRAIAEPEIWHKDKDSEFIRWKEEDDGRLGKIAISPQILNSQKFDKESGRLPVPMVSVTAAQIDYDDYNQHYEDKFRQQKLFTSPEEAFEVFLEVIINNTAKTQYDIRKTSGTRRSRHGAERTRIVDSGKFSLEELRDN